MLNMDLISDTGQTRAYPLKGRTETLKIYTIPIEQVRYNPQNGRIATYISEYEDQNGELPNEYNEIIEEFIIESNPGSFKKTKNNIKLFGQLEPAVILSNGIVVDGNRRFTALRQLSREGAGSEFEYIKAAILESSSFTEKEIKTLELNLQHGREEKVSYNPIDYLVDIYRDLIIQHPLNPLFTPEEYARQTDRKLNDIKKDMRVAQLMIEYLEFINQPYKFHFARSMKIDGPLREAERILQSNKIDTNREYEIKEIIFVNILNGKGEVTKIIRNLRKIIEDKEKFESYYESLEESLDDLNDYLHDEEIEKEITETKIINIPVDLNEYIAEVTSEEIEDTNRTHAQQKPIVDIRRALKALKDIDMNAVKRMDEKSQSEFFIYLVELEGIVNTRKEQFDAF